MTYGCRKKNSEITLVNQDYVDSLTHPIYMNSFQVSIKTRNNIYSSLNDVFVESGIR